MPEAASLDAWKGEVDAALVPAMTGEVIVALDAVGAVLPMPTDPAALDLYQRALNPYPAGVVRWAAWQLIKAQAFPRAPTVAEFVAQCDKHPAMLDWRRARNAVAMAQRERARRERNEADRARRWEAGAAKREAAAKATVKSSLAREKVQSDAEIEAEFRRQQNEVMRQCQAAGMFDEGATA